MMGLKLSVRDTCQAKLQLNVMSRKLINFDGFDWNGGRA